MAQYWHMGDMATRWRRFTPRITRGLKRSGESGASALRAATSEPAERTRLNVLSSDGTILITHGPPTGGSDQTKEFAHLLGKPWLHIDLANEPIAKAAEKAAEWLALTGCQILNIAGPRASENVHIYPAVKEFLRNLFKK